MISRNWRKKTMTIYEDSSPTWCGWVPGLLRTRQKQPRERKKCKRKAKRGLWQAGSSVLTLLATSNPHNSSKLKYYYIICKQKVCHTVALPFTFKGILRQKKSYRNSNTSACKNIIFKNSSITNQNKSFKIL
jgi:hypothetical protein